MTSLGDKLHAVAFWWTANHRWKCSLSCSTTAWLPRLKRCLRCCFRTFIARAHSACAVAWEFCAHPVWEVVSKACWVPWNRAQVWPHQESPQLCWCHRTWPFDAMSCRDNRSPLCRTELRWNLLWKIEDWRWSLVLWSCLLHLSSSQLVELPGRASKPERLEDDARIRIPRKSRGRGQGSHWGRRPRQTSWKRRSRPAFTYTLSMRERFKPQKETAQWYYQSPCLTLQSWNSRFILALIAPWSWCYRLIAPFCTHLTRIALPGVLKNLFWWIQAYLVWLAAFHPQAALPACWYSLLIPSEEMSFLRENLFIPSLVHTPMTLDFDIAWILG